MVSNRNMIVWLLFAIALFSSCKKLFQQEHEIHLKLKADFTGLETRANFHFNDRTKIKILSESVKSLTKGFKVKGASLAESVLKNGYVVEIKTRVRKDPETFIKEVLNTGELEFRFVNEALTREVQNKYTANAKDISASDIASMVKINHSLYRVIGFPRNHEVFFYYSSNTEKGEIIPQYPIVVEKKVWLIGNDIKKVWTDKSKDGRPKIHFEFTDNGSYLMKDITAPEYRGKKYAIVFNEKVICIPVIGRQIIDGRMVMIWDFTPQETALIVNSSNAVYSSIDFKLISVKINK